MFVISLNTLEVCIMSILFLLILCIYKCTDNIKEYIKKIKEIIEWYYLIINHNNIYDK